MTVLTAILLAILAPFRHQVAEPRNVSTITVVGAQDDTAQDRQGCDVSPQFGYMYPGSDGVAGFSRESCEAAYQDWRHTPASKTVLLRA